MNEPRWKVGAKVLFCFAVGSAIPAHANNMARWHPYIDEASARFGVPVRWIERVIDVESAGSTTLNGQPIRSRAGAMGLMQLMPKTWADMRSQLGLGYNPDDPHDNIIAGTFYLRLMYERFGYPGLFGAYNAGPGRYAAFLAGRQKLPSETIAYLNIVTGRTIASNLPAKILAPTSPPPLFAVRTDRPSDAKLSGNAVSQASLFVVRVITP